MTTAVQIFNKLPLTAVTALSISLAGGLAMALNGYREFFMYLKDSLK